MQFIGKRTHVVLLICTVLCVAQSGCKSKEGGFVETRVSVKTAIPAGTDPSQARALTFAEFISIPEPPGVTKNDPRYDKQRIPAFPNPLGVKEGDIVKVKGYLHLVTYMGDGDYNLHFNASADSADHYVVVEIPEDDDVSDRRIQPVIEKARGFIKSQILGGKDPSKQGSTISTPVYVEITGQLFFTDNHVGDPLTADKAGLYRATSWRIHPGLNIEIVPKPAQ